MPPVLYADGTHCLSNGGTIRLCVDYHRTHSLWRHGYEGGSLPQLAGPFHHYIPLRWITGGKGVGFNYLGFSCLAAPVRNGPHFDCMAVAAILTTVDEEALDRGMSMPENIKVRTNTEALVVWSQTPLGRGNSSKCL